ncbi:DUF1566 domain-containing protein [Thiothrix nivea]|uniref:Lcl C-terminal domain-containing protein n=1 Tax=Thiothrix nivea (strain ATCC 35100 / DSM 5205 / JP2) TaxID=870187 RepID=A0A656HE94_THINJ|nr:DUF1566 domain-containing protein [Thiothrix nivea]EIJ34683.1 protein of unknown function DUF1566 [Thiothrix nivea DSM 5205]
MHQKTITLIMGGGLLFVCANWAMAQSCNINLASTTPSQRFFDHGNGTVTDTRTDLMWKKCLEGQEGSACFGHPDLMPWELAANYAQLASGDKFAGHPGWRLPTLAELESIVDASCQEPAVNLQVFPSMPAAGLWSANQSDPVAWSMDFSKGRSYQNLKVGGKYVRLVRSSR